MTSRSWCGTSFDLEAFTFPEVVSEENRVKYGIWQLEICPHTSALHCQWYIEFTASVRHSFVKRVVGDLRSHVEIRRGSPIQARDYCRKSDSRLPGTEPSEVGKQTGQGHRADLEDVQDALDAGTSPGEIAQRYFATWCRYHRSIDRYWLENQTPRCWTMDVRVYYGPTGSGKSRRALVESDGSMYPLGHSNGGAWFDGYSAEFTIVIDDFYGWLPFSFLLQLLDRYPFKVPTKGSHIPFLSRRIIITSNVHPNQWYDYTKPHMNWHALERRITTIEEMS